MTALTAVLHTRPNNLRSVDAILERTTVRQPDALISSSLAARWTISRSDVDGMPVMRLTPNVHATGTQLLYLHGGAYVNPLVAPHWSIIKALLARTGATVTVAFYPLAPEHTASETFPKLRALFVQLQASGNPGRPLLAGGPPRAESRREGHRRKQGLSRARFFSRRNGLRPAKIVPRSSPRSG